MALPTRDKRDTIAVSGEVTFLEPDVSDVEDLDEVAKLLTLLVRLQLGSQQETILELHRLGFDNSRSADLLGTTTATVRSTVNKYGGKT